MMLTGCTSRQTSSVATSTTEPTVEPSVSAETTDTTKPVITLAKTSISANAGTKLAKLDLSEVVKSVKDDTDGTLKEVDELKDGESGYMFDYGSVKVEDKKLVKGTYTIKVTAQDKAGNKATESVELKVKAKKAETASTTTKKSDTTSKSSTSTKKSTTTKKSNSSSSSNSASTSKSNVQSNSSTSSGKASASTNKSSNSSNNSGSSNSNSSNNTTTPQKTCKTVHHDATGHTENVYGTVHHDATGHYEQVATGSVVVCNGCGTEFATYNEWFVHSGDMESSGDSTHTYHTKSTYTQQWVQDSAAYDETVVTGTKWVQDTAAYDETVCS